MASHTDLKVIQQMLGHASIVLTADTYTNPRELHLMREVCLVWRFFRPLGWGGLRDTYGVLTCGYCFAVPLDA